MKMFSRFYSFTKVFYHTITKNSDSLFAKISVRNCHIGYTYQFYSFIAPMQITPLRIFLFKRRYTNSLHSFTPNHIRIRFICLHVSTQNHCFQLPSKLSRIIVAAVYLSNIGSDLGRNMT